MNERRAKINRMTNTLAMDIKCKKCEECHENGEHEEKLHEDVETVTDFSYIGDGIYSGCGCQVAETPRTRLGLEKIRLPRFTFLKKFPLKIRGIVYRSCVRSSMLYGSQT